MSDEMYSMIGADMVEVEAKIATARRALAFLSEAGEDTTELKSKLDQLEIRKNKWVRTLQNKGIASAK